MSQAQGSTSLRCGWRFVGLRRIATGVSWLGTPGISRRGAQPPAWLIYGTIRRRNHRRLLFLLHPWSSARRSDFTSGCVGLQVSVFLKLGLWIRGRRCGRRLLGPVVRWECHDWTAQSSQVLLAARMPCVLILQPSVRSGSPGGRPDLRRGLRSLQSGPIGFRWLFGLGSVWFEIHFASWPYSYAL